MNLHIVLMDSQSFLYTSLYALTKLSRTPLKKLTSTGLNDHGGFSSENIGLAVNVITKLGMSLIVCIDDQKKQHNLEQYQDVWPWPIPEGATAVSFMDALAKKKDALIITRCSPDTWSETNKRQWILEFTMTNDKFLFCLPDDVSRINIPRKWKMINKKMERIHNTWITYQGILKEYVAATVPKNDKHGPKMIIDGSNVAMSHGLDTFFSCYGIVLAVVCLLKKDHRNIDVHVPNWRMNSKNTVVGHEALVYLEQQGFVTLTANYPEDDTFMFRDSDRDGWIMSNDTFRQFKERENYKDAVDRRIPFNFKGNHFRVNESSYKKMLQAVQCAQVCSRGQEECSKTKLSTEAVQEANNPDRTVCYEAATWKRKQHGKSEVRQRVFSEGSACVQNPALAGDGKVDPDHTCPQQTEPPSTQDGHEDQQEENQLEHNSGPNVTATSPEHGPNGQLQQTRNARKGRNKKTTLNYVRRR